MLGFEDLLMQIVNNVTTVPPAATTAIPVPTTDVFDQINALASTISLLVTTVGGFATYIIIKWRSVRKEELTVRDKQMLELAKDIQMGFQKGVETIGQTKEVAKILYESQTTDEQRKKVQEQLSPVLADVDARLQKANEQAALVKTKAVQMFGPAADVDQDPTIPRESPSISQKLRKV